LISKLGRSSATPIVLSAHARACHDDDASAGGQSRRHGQHAMANRY
jgi:hypothetical protein